MSKLIPDLNFGPNLKKLRVKNHLTQQDVANRLDSLGLNVSRSVYSRYENGTLNVPVTVVRALSDIFKCDYNALFSIGNAGQHDRPE
jgi:transcriptional regulator with XRE-family HTH domain